MQLRDEEYDTEEDVRARDLMSPRQYLAYLKANSDAERGKSGYHGVAGRSNNRWQSRITGVAVWLPHPMQTCDSEPLVATDPCVLRTCACYRCCWGL